MKRFIGFMLCVLVLGALCACGEGDENVSFESKAAMQQALCGPWLMVTEFEKLEQPHLVDPEAEEYWEEGEILKAAGELFIDSNPWGFLGEYLAWSVSGSELAMVWVSEEWVSRCYYDTVEAYEQDMADGVLGDGDGQPIDGWKWRRGVLSVPGTTYDVRLDEAGNYCLVNRMNGDIYAVKMEAVQ